MLVEPEEAFSDVYFDGLELHPFTHMRTQELGICSLPMAAEEIAGHG